MRRSRVLQSIPLALISVLWLSSAAHAQIAVPRWPSRDSSWDRAAYDNGYRKGVDIGERDARSGRPFDYSRHSEWRNADGRGWGDRARYEREYRDGFERGYREGYERNSRYGRGYPGYPDSRRYPGYPDDRRYPGYPDSRGYPGGYGYRDHAFQQGINDGYREGLNDARDRDRFDPVGNKQYRKADRGYDKRYGSKDAYRDRYRDGFRTGYERGYREARVGYGRNDRNARWPW